MNLFNGHPGGSALGTELSGHCTRRELAMASGGSTELSKADASIQMLSNSSLLYPSACN